MNWKEIKKKYPKAVNKLFDWLHIYEYKSGISKEAGTKWYQFEQDCLYPCDGFSWNERGLYDFFDEQKIYITIKADCSKLFKPKNGIVVWDNQVTSRSSGCGDGDFENRERAEEDAFLEAFEILERRLK